MRVRARTILTDAWTRWRGDWPVLTAVAGVFVLLPQLAVFLFVPDLVLPAKDGAPNLNDPAIQALVTRWLLHDGVWQLAAIVAARFAQFAMVAWYVAARWRTVGQAIGIALVLAPRLIGATLLWGVPTMMLVGFLTVTGLSMLVYPIVALVLARMLLVGPAIVAERPIGAVDAVRRSVTATRGHMAMLATFVLGIAVAQAILRLPSAMLDQWMVAHGPNPVARVIVDAFAAIVVSLGAIALALVQVAAWTRLSSR